MDPLAGAVILVSYLTKRADPSVKPTLSLTRSPALAMGTCNPWACLEAVLSMSRSISIEGSPALDTSATAPEVDRMEVPSGNKASESPSVCSTSTRPSWKLLTVALLSASRDVVAMFARPDAATPLPPRDTEEEEEDEEEEEEGGEESSS
jgi:hypothetical protein